MKSRLRAPSRLAALACALACASAPAAPVALRVDRNRGHGTVLAPHPKETP